MPPPRDLHPLVIAIVELWARGAKRDPETVWRWVRREEKPPAEDLRRLIEWFWPLLREDDFGPRLTSPQDLATLATMPQAETTREQRVSRARLGKKNRQHPFVVALLEQRMTVSELAKAIGYSRSTVQSWYDTRKANARPIPTEAAEAIKERLGVPLSAWTKKTP